METGSVTVKKKNFESVIPYFRKHVDADIVSKIVALIVNWQEISYD